MTFVNNESYLTDYNKTGEFNVYPYISDKIVKAYQNAAWIRKVSQSENIYDNNPYTDVDLLVKYLTLNGLINSYLILNEVIEINDIQFKFTLEENVVFLYLNNNSNTSFVTNSLQISLNREDDISIPNTLIRVKEEKKLKLCSLEENDNLFVRLDNHLIEVDCTVL